jgi:hypothetical protein
LPVFARLKGGVFHKSFLKLSHLRIGQKGDAAASSCFKAVFLLTSYELDGESSY